MAKNREYFPFLGFLIIFELIVFSLVLYYPALTVEYGINEDYTMLAFDKNKPFDFHLIRTFFLRGRAVGGMLFLWQSLMLKQIADFVVFRWVSLLFLLLFLGLLVRFLKKKCGLENFWLFILCLAALVLPSSQIAVLRISILTTTSMIIVLAALNYYWFHYSCAQRTGFAIFGLPWTLKASLVGSLLLFVMCLFIYPANAMAIWIFTFALILFRPMSSWGETRKIFVRDLLFFGTGLLVYRVLEQKVVMPMVLSTFQPDQLYMVNRVYSMELATEFVPKMQLLWNLFLVSAAGPWHVVVAKKGAIVFLTVLSLGLIALAKRWRDARQNSLSDASSAAGHWIEKSAAATILLSLANLPLLLGKGVVAVQGYRAMIPMAIMIVLLQIWSLRSFRMTFQGAWGKVLTIGFICLWLISMSMVGFRHVGDAVANYHHELKMMRSAVSRFGPKRWNRIVVIYADRKKSFVGRFFQYEFGFMIRYNDHVNPFLWEKFDKELLDRNKVSLIVADSSWRKSNVLGKKDYLVDLGRGAYIKK